MRPGFGSLSPAATAAGGAATSLWRWDSPLPYLFGGLGFLMGLIAVALIILTCFNCKSSSTGSSSSGEQKPARSPLDMEPRIVVIMAGDAIPSFLAKAVPSAAQPPSQQ